MSVLLILSASAQAAEPAGLDDVLHALSMRHPLPCDEIEGKTSTPVDTLLHVVDTVTMPPWSPMKAAECLIKGHGAEVQAHLERWVVEPELKGLGLMVLNDLDSLPTEVAVSVATKAVNEGSDPAKARERVAEAKSAEVRAIVEAK